MHVETAGGIAESDTGPETAPPFGDWKIQALFEHWGARMRGHRWPSRADLDPMAMPRALLPHVMVTQLAHDGRELLRLVGTHITEHLGLDPTRRTLEDLAGEGNFADLCRSLHAEMRSAATPLHAHGRHVSPRGVPRTCERLVCPLSHDGEQPDATVSCLVFAAPAHAEPIAAGGSAERTRAQPVFVPVPA